MVILAIVVFFTAGLHHDVALRINHWRYDVQRVETPFHGGVLVWGERGQIYFVANGPALDGEGSADQRRRDRHLYRYDIDDREVEVVRRDVNTGYLCYADGWLYFSDKQDKDRNWSTYKDYVKKNVYDGELRPVHWDLSGNRRIKKSLKSCELIEKPEFVDEGEAWTPLQSDVFLLHDLGMLNSKLPYRITRDGVEDISLPFGAGEYYSTMMQWAEWKDMFFSTTLVANDKDRRRWRQRECLKSYWFDIDGRVKKICIPSGEWSHHNLAHTKVYKKGVIFDVKSGDRDKSGIYITTGDSSARIESGYTREPYVSPDGCSVAFGWLPNTFDRLGRRTGNMQIVTADLC